MHLREGSFRQRAKRSEALTEQLREHRRRKVAAQTHEALNQFEDSLNAEQEAMSRAFDEIPTEAAGFQRSRTMTAGSFSPGGSGGMNSFGNSAFGSHSGLQHSQSEPAMNAGGLNPETSIDRDPRIIKPPSPFNFYEYGSVSPKSRSRFVQHRRRLGEQEKPSFRQTSCGFYHPGTHFVHGTYGDKLQDPCLYPPVSWQSPIEGCSTRRGPDSGDLRPLAAQDLQVGRHKPRNGEPIPDLVRGNVAYEHRARRNNEALHKRREEAVLEHARFESGVFDGRWRDPLLDSKGALPEPGPSEDHAWMGSAAVESMLGREEELGLSAAQLSALRLVVGLDIALRQARSRLTDLFNAENHGPKCQLEPDELLKGLVRLGITATCGFTEESLCEAMSVIDPRFDGRISLPVLGRALKAVRASTSPQRAPTSRLSRFSWSGEQDSTGSRSCGEAAPVEAVIVEKQAESISNFNKSFTKFKKQQSELLDHHLKMTGSPEPFIK